jgi:hypothetical protein
MCVPVYMCVCIYVYIHVCLCVHVYEYEGTSFPLDNSFFIIVFILVLTTYISIPLDVHLQEV